MILLVCSHAAPPFLRATASPSCPPALLTSTPTPPPRHARVTCARLHRSTTRSVAWPPALCDDRAVPDLSAGLSALDPPPHPPPPPLAPASCHSSTRSSRQHTRDCAPRQCPRPIGVPLRWEPRTPPTHGCRPQQDAAPSVPPQHRPAATAVVPTRLECPPPCKGHIMSTPDPEDASSSPEHSGQDMAAQPSTAHPSADGSPAQKPAPAKVSAKDPLRPRRKKAKRACFACQRAHLTCGECWGLRLV